MPHAVEVQSPDHWTAREFPVLLDFCLKLQDALGPGGDPLREGLNHLSVAQFLLPCYLLTPGQDLEAGPPGM